MVKKRIALRHRETLTERKSELSPLALIPPVSEIKANRIRVTIGQVLVIVFCSVIFLVSTILGMNIWKYEILGEFSYHAGFGLITLGAWLLE